ncbi:hypothetical protein PMIN03_003238 [Paraphaeosphaeria minitans]
MPRQRNPTSTSNVPHAHIYALRNDGKEMSMSNTNTNTNTAEPNASRSEVDATMAKQHLALTLILAATPSLGIGRAGALPWPQLRKEMAYFRRVTSRVPKSVPTSGGSKRCNAVVMGRKTWDSIPPRFRPLEGRVNVVVTRSPGAFTAKLGAAGGGKEGHGNVQAVSSLHDALSLLQSYHSAPGEASDRTEARPEIGRVFVIGGATMYDAAMALPQTERALLTKIQEEYECDTFFSVDLDRDEGWRRCGKEEVEGWVGEQIEPVEEKGVKFEFQMFERVR